MGKARRQKNHGAAARAAADSSTAVSSQETSLPPNAANGGQASADQMDMKAGVLDGLTSLNALTREASCAAIASLFEKIDSPEAGNDSWLAAQRLIAGGLVKKLLPRMVDRAPDVKLQATGAMRNISAVRDPRVCEIMVHDDCLTPVLTLLDRMSTADAAAAAASAAAAAGAAVPQESAGAVGPPTAAQTTAAISAKQETVVIAQLVATLCNLLAAVDVAVGRFTKQGGLQVVMRLLLPEGCRGSAEVFGGALQALHVATDSNVDLARQLAALPGAVDQLSALVRGADVAHVKVSTAMRVQAAGVLVNVAGLSTEAATATSPEAQAELSRLVLPLLLEQMAYDPAVLQQACVALALAAAAPAETKPTAKSTGAENMDVDGGGAAAAATNGNGACGTGVAGEEGRAEAMEDAEAAAAAAAGAQVVAAVAASTPMQVATGQVIHEQSEGSPAGVVSGDESGKQGGGEKEAVADQPDMDAQVRWEWKFAVAEPLKLTAEVLTNLCTLAAGEEGEGDEDEEEEWGSDDEDAMEQAASGNGQGLNANGETAAGAGGSSVVLADAMVERGALPRTVAALKALLSRTPRDDQLQQPSGIGGGAGAAGTPTPTSTEVGAMSPPAPKSDRLPLPAGTAGDLADLRATVALCAANLVQNLPPGALGQDPHALWMELCGMCEAAMERAPSCVETLTGVMWGLARRAGPAVAAGIRSSAATAAAAAPGAGADSSATDPLPLLLRLCDPEKTRAFEARVNAVGMLGALGSATAAAAVDESGPSEAARRADVSLGRALVQAMEDPHVLVQAEALNAVMDVYGEDGRDAAFRETGAPAALVAGVPAFRRKVKQEGVALGRDALCHLKETALNASRFVKYKQIAVEGSRGGSGR